MNSEFQSLPPETQEAVKRTMDTMEPAQTPAEIRETLEGTQKGGVKNSIRNCLTVFQRDPLFRGALRLNLLTEQIDIVKPLGWERTSTTLTDMDMNYLLLYLEENYGLTSEKKVQSAIFDKSIVKLPCQSEFSIIFKYKLTITFPIDKYITFFAQ